MPSRTVVSHFAAAVTLALLVASCGSANDAATPTTRTNDARDNLPSGPASKIESEPEYSIGSCISSPGFLLAEVIEAECDEKHFGSVFDEVEIVEAEESTATRTGPSRLEIDRAILLCNASPQRTIGEVFLIPPPDPAWADGARTGRCIAAAPLIPRDASGSLTSDGFLHQSRLQPGDCFEDSAIANIGESAPPENTVNVVSEPCDLQNAPEPKLSEETMSEVFATPEVDLETYPDEAEVRRLSNDLCAAEAPELPDQAGRRRPLTVRYFFASESDWEIDSSKPLICFLGYDRFARINPDDLTRGS